VVSLSIIQEDATYQPHSHLSQSIEDALTPLMRWIAGVSALRETFELSVRDKQDVIGGCRIEAGCSGLNSFGHLYPFHFALSAPSPAATVKGIAKGTKRKHPKRPQIIKSLSSEHPNSVP
jgi:hypothetical protein